MGTRKKVAVIFGGESTEHEVSRFSAQSVISKIDRDKYDVIMVGITKDGRWLPYNGPVEKLGSGEWQAIAEAACDSARSALMTARAGAETDKSGLGCCEKGIIPVGGTPASVLGAAGESGQIDVVFPVLHGCNGEDGTIQGLFELAGIPYVGSGVLGSALGMDKAYAKIVFEKNCIPQGKYIVFSRKKLSRDNDGAVAQVEQLLEYPCFVKPSNAGSSVGVSKAHNRAELVAGLRLAAEYDRRVLAEEFINGREMECSVLGNDDPVASTVGEVMPCNEFYDYDAKYGSESNSKIIIPAELPERTIAQIREYAVRAFKALDCGGLARVDFFVHKETGEVYINELNTMPGFTRISMYPKLWEASGISYGMLVEKLIDLAIERFGDSRKRIDE